MRFLQKLKFGFSIRQASDIMHNAHHSSHSQKLRAHTVWCINVKEKGKMSISTFNVHSTSIITFKCRTQHTLCEHTVQTPSNVLLLAPNRGLWTFFFHYFESYKFNSTKWNKKSIVNDLHKTSKGIWDNFEVSPKVKKKNSSLFSLAEHVLQRCS